MVVPEDHVVVSSISHTRWIGEFRSGDMDKGEDRSGRELLVLRSPQDASPSLLRYSRPMFVRGEMLLEGEFVEEEDEIEDRGDHTSASLPESLVDDEDRMGERSLAKDGWWRRGLQG
jgi:hypothetical protein